MLQANHPVFLQDYAVYEILFVEVYELDIEDNNMNKVHISHMMVLMILQ